jgi:hypothetical protein
VDALYKNVDAEHLGGGVVVFRGALEFDSKWVVDFSEEQISKERAEMYTPTINPETGKPAFLNKSGYIFDADGVNKMPRRGSQIQRTDRPDVREFLDFLESSKDKYLLKYFAMFPLAYKNVWWKVKGHLVSYSTEYGGEFLGSHSDTSADYSYGYPHPSDQLATRNTISCIVYLNDNFEGGHHYFNYLDIDYEPSVGDILMFPSNYMAAHEVKPTTNGSRYTYLGWYSHGSPNKEVNEHIVDPIVDSELSKTATNVYMPTLRADFMDYLKSVNVGKDSIAWKLVESMN